MSSADEQVYPVADIEIDSSGDGVYLRFICVTDPQKAFEQKPLTEDDFHPTEWFSLADDQLAHIYRTLGKILEQKMLLSDQEQSPGVH